MMKYESLKLDNQLCFSLYAVSREIIKLYKPLLDELNLTYTQYLVMLVLWEEEKTTVKNIGNRLHLDSGTLTPLLKKLEASELIRRHRSKEADRVVNIEITNKGLELQDKAKKVPGKILCRLNIEEDKVVNLKKELDVLLNEIK